MINIDDILFDGPMDWLRDASGLSFNEDFSNYILAIDMIDVDYYLKDTYIFHICVYNHYCDTLITSYSLELPRNVDFMILVDTWDSGKDLFFYDPHQERTVHRFYNKLRYTYPMPNYNFLGNEYVLEDGYHWSNKGRRYFSARINTQKQIKLRDDKPGETPMMLALDIFTYEVISFVTLADMVSIPSNYSKQVLETLINLSRIEMKDK